MRRILLLLALFASIFLSVAPARAAVTEVDNLANAYGNGATLNFTTSERAGAFTTGAAATTLASVTARLLGPPNGADSVAQMSLFTDNFGLPDALIETLSGNPIPNGGNYTFGSAGTALAANTTYWLVLAKLSGTTLMEWQVSADFSETSPNGWTIADKFAFSEDSGANWGSNTLFAAQFSVAVVPEPATAILLLLGIVGVSAMRARLDR